MVIRFDLVSNTDNCAHVKGVKGPRHITVPISWDRGEAGGCYRQVV